MKAIVRWALIAVGVLALGMTTGRADYTKCADYPWFNNLVPELKGFACEATDHFIIDNMVFSFERDKKVPAERAALVQKAAHESALLSMSAYRGRMRSSRFTRCFSCSAPRWP